MLIRATGIGTTHEGLLGQQAGHAGVNG
jgi:hypothetical protein